MSFFNRLFPMFRRSLWVAVLAMLLPVLVPLLHHPATQAGAGFARICSYTPAPDSSDKAPHGKLPACPLCHSLHLAGHGLPPVGGDFALVAPGVRGFAVPVAVRFLLSYRLAPVAWPRAPPVLA